MQGLILGAIGGTLLAVPVVAVVTTIVIYLATAGIVASAVSTTAAESNKQVRSGKK